MEKPKLTKSSEDIIPKVNPNFSFCQSETHIFVLESDLDFMSESEFSGYIELLPAATTE